MAPKKTAASRLDEAHAAHNQAKDRLARLHADRNSALLRDDDTAALRLDAEIDIAERTVKACADKLTLLREEAKKEATERRAKERAALIGRIEAKFKERDEIGRELGEAIEKADALFRRLFEVAKEIRAAWPWQHFEIPPTLLGEPIIARSVEFEIYRVGARPAPLGGATRQGAPSFPGGKSPHINLTLDPGRITPLAEALRKASRFGSEIMRTGKASGVVPVTMVSLPPQAGGEPRERTDAEQRLAELLRKQIKLAEDVSPRGDELYAANLAEIVKVQAEIDEFRALAANGSQS